MIHRLELLTVLFKRVLPCCVLACVLLSAAWPLQAQKTPPRASAGSAVEQARQLLQAGQATEALALAQRARRQNAQDYRAAYYIAYALMALEDYVGAVSAHQDALALARTEEQQASVRALGEAIAARAGAQEARAAERDGLFAKAARLYAQAFEAGHPDPAVGLKAAELHEKQLHDPVKAGLLYRALAARDAGEPSATAAREAQRLKPQLVARSREILVVAAKTHSSEREPLVREALELDPDSELGNVYAFLTQAQQDDWEGVRRTAIRLQQLDRLDFAITAYAQHLFEWMEDERFQALLRDMWGDKRVDLLRKAKIPGGWQVEERASGASCVARGLLALRRVNDDLSYSGYLEITPCGGQQVRVWVEATHEADDVRAELTPRQQGQSSGPRRYVLKRTQDGQMEGVVEDDAGRPLGEVILRRASPR